jgi:Cysteine-rich secretory protein family
MLSMVNAERAAAGVGAVQQTGWAHSVAQQHSQDMAAAGDIWHNIAGFIDQGRAAMGATYLGENVAMDSTLAANDALLYSDIPHRNVTLDGRFNYVGLGIALDSKNWVYVTEDFAQIPGGAPQHAAAAISKPVAAQPAPVAKPPVVKAPVVKAPVAKAPVAVATAKPAPITAQVVVAAPAPAAAAIVAAKAPAPAVAVPAAPPAQPVQAISAKPVSHSSHSGSVWILVGLVGLLMAAFTTRRFVSILRQARRQRPVATACSLGKSPSSRSPWRRAA